MRDVTLAPEEREIVAAVSRFVDERVRPEVARLEENQIYPQALVEEMKALGLFGIAVPEEFGGLGLRLPALAAVFEVLASGWSTLAAYVNSHSTVAYALRAHGSEAQKLAYLPRLAAGEHQGALCLTEPDCGSDLRAIRSAVRPAEAGYELNGSKTYVTNGARAGLLLTLAKHPAAEGEERPRISLFLVEKALPGVSVTTTFHKTAFGLVDTVQIEMDAVPLARGQLLGEREGAGFAQLMDSLEVGRIAIASSAVGLATTALSEAKRFAGERRTFGVTIDQHQAVQLRLANMATKLVAARLITMEAARIKEDGGRCDMITAMAKTYASDAAIEIAHDAVIVHGGAGYIREYAVERLNREALLYAIGEGTNDINRLVVARRMGGPDEMHYLGLIV